MISTEVRLAWCPSFTGHALPVLRLEKGKNMDIPRIRVELEGVRRAVMSMLSENDELEQLVNETIRARITDDWVKGEIERAVESCISKAISGIADNYEVQNIIRQAIVIGLKEGVGNDRL